MIGHSEALEKIKHMIEKVAPSDARVLITGPNGSGKELVARQLHEKAIAGTMHLLKSIVLPFLPNLSKVNYSDTKKALSLPPSNRKKENSNWHTAVRSFWMKSAI